MKILWSRFLSEFCVFYCLNLMLGQLIKCVIVENLKWFLLFCMIRYNLVVTPFYMFKGLDIC